MFGSLFNLCLLVAYVVSPTTALFEDQVGKFEWIQRYIGPVEHVAFDTSSLPVRRIIVSTKHNVLAALAVKNGEILWRQTLENSDNSAIDHLSLEQNIVTTISSNLVRTWDSISTSLLEEVLLDYTPSHSPLQRVVYVTDREVVLAELQVGSVEVNTFNLSKGSSLGSHIIPAPWMQSSTKCKSVESHLVCVELSLGLVFSVSLINSDATFTTVPLTSFGIDEEQQAYAATTTSYQTVQLLPVPGCPAHILLQVGKWKKLVHVYNSELNLVRDVNEDETVTFDQEKLFILTQKRWSVTIHAAEDEGNDQSSEPLIAVKLPDQTGSVESFSVYLHDRKDGGVVLRAFVICSDHSIHFLGTSGLLWTREEGLSSLLVAEAVDLPVAGAAVNYQDQLSLQAGLVSSLILRFKTQWMQISSMVLGILGHFGQSNSYQSAPQILTRDQFNLHKLLVVVSASGKMFALDNWSGEVMWSIYVPNLSALSNNKILLFTQRSVAHFPHEPQCVIVGKNRLTNEGMLFVFHPITGIGIGENNGVISLGYELIHTSILHQADERHLKSLLLVDTLKVPHVFPSSGEKVILASKAQMFVHLATPDTTNLAGYTLNNSLPGALRLSPVWNVMLGSGSITGIYGKLPNEKVHSPGRVLADRSVLYKYVNPNLVVVTTSAYDHINKNTMTVHLVDTVTGAVIESVAHKRVSGQIHIVHSENWVVYSCFNDKFRRFEVTALEMFEGINQANATAFSSFGGRATPPIVERQAFIMPVGIQAATHTTTERGITTKFILFALESGGVLQMSKWFLDPRRPISQGGPREEGLIPYMPELPLPPQEMITYNNTLPRVTAIYTSPTGLESTCIVLVYGLDLFYTRVFPSKMFDVLKDDFDHLLIIGALLSLASAALITRKFAQRKALKQAWK